MQNKRGKDLKFIHFYKLDMSNKESLFLNKFYTIKKIKNTQNIIGNRNW